MKNLLRNSFLIMVIAFAMIFASQMKAQVSVTPDYKHDIYNAYSFSGAINSLANDTTAEINPHAKGMTENIFTLYSYTHQAHDSVYIKIYREVQGISGYWTNSTLVGVDSLGGAKVWSDTLAHKYLKTRYVMDGSNSTAKKNGVGTTYDIKVLNERVKKIKLE